MLACYYPQGKQRFIDGLKDSYKIGEVYVRPRRGARRGFAKTERAIRGSVSLSCSLLTPSNTPPPPPTHCLSSSFLSSRVSSTHISIHTYIHTPYRYCAP